MGRMIDKLEFHEHDGSKADHDLTLYALTTCAFCKRAIQFLQDQDVRFRYIYLDEINPMVKQTVKSELKSQFKRLPVFPVLVVDNEEAVSGFSEEKWKARLNLE
jgi:glutaredoxin